MIRTPKMVPPHFFLVKIDETDYFDTDAGKMILQSSGGRIYGVYLYDENHVTYICSAEKNYFLHYIEHVPEAWPEDDDERSELIDLLSIIAYDGPHDDYHNCSRVDGIRSEFKVDLGLKDEICTDDEESYKECLEEMLEHVRGNSYF